MFLVLVLTRWLVSLECLRACECSASGSLGYFSLQYVVCMVHPTQTGPGELDTTAVCVRRRPLEILFCWIAGCIAPCLHLDVTACTCSPGEMLCTANFADCFVLVLLALRSVNIGHTTMIDESDGNTTRITQLFLC